MKRKESPPKQKARPSKRPRHIQLVYDMYGDAPFNNAANRKRTILIVIDKTARPAPSITQSCRDEAIAKGAYLLLGNYHRALRSDCQAEKTPFEDARAIIRLLAILSIVAIKILQLRELARTDRKAPCTIALADYEWRVLWSIVHESPPYQSHAPTVEEAVKLIGRLGNHLGRKGDGMPGADSLSRGLRELEIAANICRILNVDL